MITNKIWRWEEKKKKKRIVCLFQLLEKNKDQISTEIAKQEELSKKLQTANIDYEGKYFKVNEIKSK